MHHAYRAMGWLGGSLPASEQKGASPFAARYTKDLIEERLFWSRSPSSATRATNATSCRPTIRGHVFCSFLALVLIKELHARLDARDAKAEWADVLHDLERLEEVELEQDGKRFLLRLPAVGVCAEVFRAAGVALPPTVRQLASQDDDE